MSKVIDQDGNAQMFYAHYWRYFGSALEECASPEDARAYLRNGEEEGELSSCCVVWPDGRFRAYDWINERLGDFQPVTVHEPRARLVELLKEAHAQDTNQALQLLGAPAPRAD